MANPGSLEAAFDTRSMMLFFATGIRKYSCFPNTVAQPLTKISKRYDSRLSLSSWEIVFSLQKPALLNVQGADLH